MSLKMMSKIEGPYILISNMRHSVFPCPYCLRAGIADNNEGFYMVESGVVVIEHESKKLMICEKQIYDERGLGAPAVLEISLDSSSLTRIGLRPFRSAGMHFAGGKMVLEGLFDDKRGNEKITIRTDIETYRNMRELLLTLM